MLLRVGTEDERCCSAVGGIERCQVISPVGGGSFGMAVLCQYSCGLDFG